jgi:hypothetical protein
MLTLKDLSADKELDRKALTEVRGGSVYNTSIQGASSSATGGLVGYSSVSQGQFIYNSDNDISLSQEYAFNIGSPFGVAIA